MSNNILIIPFVTYAYQYSYCHGIVSKAELINSTYFRAVYNFRASCTIGGTTASNYLIIDRTKLQSSKTLYVDHYSLNLVEGISLSTKWAGSYNSAQSATMISTACNHTMIGWNSIWTSTLITSYYFYYTCGSSSVGYTGSGYITTMNFTVTGFRVRACDPGTKFFNDIDNLCYDACPDRYYGDPVNHFCAPCAYNCLTCSEDGILCFSCSATDFRTFINTTLVNFTRAGTC